MVDRATLAELTEATTFTVDEIQMMYEHFADSANPHTGIQREDFFRILGSDPDSHFENAVFGILSGEKERFSFSDLVKTVAIYRRKVKNVPEIEKQRLFFKFYDADNDGFISEEDLKKVLLSCFSANSMTVRDEEVDRLVTNTFAKYGGRGTKIDPAAYSTAAFSHKSSYC